MFIVIEGPDGLGKSTLASGLTKAIAQSRRKVFQTREPGGTPMAEEIRTVLLEDRNEKVDPMTEFFLFMAGRNQHVKEVISVVEPTDVVVCDRYFYSTYVYQCLLGEVPKELFRGVVNLTDMPFPDVLIHLDGTPDMARERQQQLEQDRMDKEFTGTDQMRSAYRQAFSDLNHHKTSLVTLNAGDSPEELVRKAMMAIFE